MSGHTRKTAPNLAGVDGYRRAARELTRDFARTMGRPVQTEGHIEDLTPYARSILVRSAFTGDPADLRVVEALMAAEHNPVMNLVSELTAQALWHQWQQPTFHVTEALWARFALTDPQAVRGADLHLPFPAFMVVPPPGLLRIVDMDDGGVTEGIAILVAKTYDAADVATLGVYLLPDMSHSGTTVYRRAPWPAPEASVAATLLSADGSLTDEDKSYFMPAVRGVINLCIYLYTEAGKKEADLSAPPKRRRRAPAGEGPTRRFTVGRRVKVSEAIRAAGALAAQGRPVQALKTGHVVRGHQRLQAYGPGRALRKIVTIDPYERGPSVSEAAERAFRDYQVGE